MIFWGSGDFFHVFSVVFQANTDKETSGKKPETIHGTQKFDAKTYS